MLDFRVKDTGLFTSLVFFFQSEVRRGRDLTETTKNINKKNLQLTHWKTRQWRPIATNGNGADYLRSCCCKDEHKTEDVTDTKGRDFEDFFLKRELLMESLKEFRET
jgi:hypothetical protein